VNPNSESINGDKCYNSINDLPKEVDRLYIVTPAAETAETVRIALDNNIRNIWIQQRSDTTEALDLLKDKDVNLIYKRCILMFADPVKGPHKVHRFFNKLFGTYPK
jgi:predicted CoA-binding protein